ncbi:MAG: L,D-transpeptidase, partial [Nanoarchaeota archaeon]
MQAMKMLFLVSVIWAATGQASFAEMPKIEIDLSDKTLTYHADSTIVYDIAVGMEEYPTPTGTYSIWSIDKQPDWCPDPKTPWLRPKEREYIEENKCIPYWNPLNPFTRYRLRFFGAYSIHGTKYSNVEGQESHGCVRMRAKDITDLVENKGLSTGTKVIIHE